MSHTRVGVTGTDLCEKQARLVIQGLTRHVQPDSLAESKKEIDRLGRPPVQSVTYNDRVACNDTPNRLTMKLSGVRYRFYERVNLDTSR